MTFLDF